MKTSLLAFVSASAVFIAAQDHYYNNGRVGRQIQQSRNSQGSINVELDVDTRGLKENLETVKKYGTAGAKFAETANKYGSSVSELGGKFEGYKAKGKKGISVAKNGYYYGSKAKQAMNGEGEWGAKINKAKGAAKTTKEAGSKLSSMFSKKGVTESGGNGDSDVNGDGEVQMHVSGGGRNSGRQGSVQNIDYSW